MAKYWIAPILIITMLWLLIFSIKAYIDGQDEINLTPAAVATYWTLTLSSFIGIIVVLCWLQA